MKRRRRSKPGASRRAPAERVVHVGYIGNESHVPPPPTIEIPDGFRPRWFATLPPPD